MAGAVQLTEVDFEQIKKNLVNYLKSTNKFTDFDFDGSNLSVILNLIAYQAQLNAYSTNMIANESFLASSTIRRNVIKNAKMLGYVPKSVTAAVNEVSFTFDLFDIPNVDEIYPNGFPNYIQINPGVVFVAKGSKKQLRFNALDSIKASVDSNGVALFNSVPLYEGTILTTSFTQDDSVFNQRFILENKNIDTTSIRIEVQENPNEDATKYYTRATNLTMIDEESRVYWLEEYEDGYWELTFGDGVFGHKLINGAKINVTYLISAGEEGNGIKNPESLVYAAVGSDSSGNKVTLTPLVTKVGGSQGGSPEETVPSIKFRAPKQYSAQNRCVTVKDYETIIRNVYPGIEDMFVFGGEEMEIPEYGRVYAVIKPEGSDHLSSSAKIYIKESIEPFRVASLDIKIIDPDVLNIEVESDVFYNQTSTKKDAAGIRSDIIQLLQELAESKVVRNFGGNVKYSKIVGSIDDANEAIIRNTTKLRMMKKFEVPINTSSTYEICFENSLEVDNNNPVIYSTGFRIPDSQFVHYFENEPQVGFEEMGNIRMFHFNEFNEKVIDNKLFGSIHYPTGEIKLGYVNPITISESLIADSAIEVRAYPSDSGKSVFARKSVFLRMNLEDSLISVYTENEV